MSALPSPPPSQSPLQDLRAALTRRRADLLDSVPAEAARSPSRGAASRSAGATRASSTICWPPCSAASRRAASAPPHRGSPWRRGPRIRRRAPGSLGPVALAGVGSYGRGAVALKSDLDVRLCAPTPARRPPSPRRSSIRSGTWASPSATRWSPWTTSSTPPATTCPPPRASSTGATWPGDRGLSDALRRRGEETHLRPLGAAPLPRPAGGRGGPAARSLRRLGVPARARREERRGRAARPRRGALGGQGALRRGRARGAGARRRARPPRGGRDPRGERDALARAQPAPRPRGPAQRPAHLRRAGDHRRRCSATAPAATASSA